MFQLEYLPIPIFNNSINNFVGQSSFFISLLLFLIAIIFVLYKKKLKSLFYIPLLIFIFFIDYIFSAPKRNICNKLIIFINKNREPEKHINPILGVTMHKEVSRVVYNWSFIYPESGSSLIYEKNHNLQNTSGNSEEIIILNKDWYRDDFDVEF